MKKALQIPSLRASCSVSETPVGGGRGKARSGRPRDQLAELVVADPGGQLGRLGALLRGRRRRRRSGRGGRRRPWLRNGSGSEPQRPRRRLPEGRPELLENRLCQARKLEGPGRGRRC